ncbi:MAG: hypothetical protein KAR19_01830 [Bacteroidales bacterium]|nr:hypothetical protein [Bacteroidales bacterium]
MKKNIYTLAIFIIWPLLLQAQDTPEVGEPVDTISTDVDLFNELDPMDITLTFDLKKYQRNKYEGKYLPVHFLYHINDTLSIEKSIRIKVRGEFRRKHCSFAPFWLNIRKADVANQHLQEVKRMKIVTHCRGADEYADYLLKEYLTYKIYNILSPISFRVRLLRMKYVDTGRKNRVTESWAFMIEPEGMLAERYDALAVKNDQLGMIFMEQETMDLVALFQFMIGNADYSITGRHNVKILGLPGFGSEGYTPVPYDFDYTGLVNAYYAIPGENLGITSVTERHFLGLCRDVSEYQQVINHMENHRDEILDMINSFPYLGEKQKNEMVSYLEGFFILASDPGLIRKELKRTCR